MADARFLQLLVDAGLLAPEQLARMRAREAQIGEARVDAELYELALRDERRVCEALAKKLGTPAIVLSESTLDLAALDVLPEAIARQHVVLPVGMDDQTITLAATDVGDRFFFDQVAFAAARRVVVLVAVPRILVDAVPAAYAARHQGQRLLVGSVSREERPWLSIARAVKHESVLDGDALFGELQEELARSTKAAHHLATPLAHLVGPPPTGGAAGAPPRPATFPHAGPLPPLATPLPSTSPLHGRAPTPAPGSPSPHGRVPTPTPAPSTLHARVPTPAPSRSAQHAAVPTPTPSPAPAALMLAVEDDEQILRMLERTFTHDGFRVVAARSGGEAVQVLRQVRPDVVVLDAMLPVVHGFQICAALKGAEAFRTVPVVMISAVYKGWEQAREIQETHGADAFVEKPFDMHFVRKLVAGLLRRPLERAPPTPDMLAAVEAVRAVLEQHKAAGRLGDAVAQVELWLSVDPFDPAAHLEMGELKSRGGDFVGALSCYECAAVYAPHLFAAQLNLARFYEKLGFTRRARETYLKARDVAPDAQTRARIEQHLVRA